MSEHPPLLTRGEVNLLLVAASVGAVGLAATQAYADRLGQPTYTISPPVERQLTDEGQLLANNGSVRSEEFSPVWLPDLSGAKVLRQPVIHSNLVAASMLMIGYREQAGVGAEKMRRYLQQNRLTIRERRQDDSHQSTDLDGTGQRGANSLINRWLGFALLDDHSAAIELDPSVLASGHSGEYLARAEYLTEQDARNPGAEASLYIGSEVVTQVIRTGGILLAMRVGTRLAARAERSGIETTSRRNFLRTVALRTNQAARYIGGATAVNTLSSTAAVLYHTLLTPTEGQADNQGGNGGSRYGYITDSEPLRRTLSRIVTFSAV